jgi:hypothetical protein
LLIVIENGESGSQLINRQEDAEAKNLPLRPTSDASHATAGSSFQARLYIGPKNSYSLRLTMSAVKDHFDFQEQRACPHR